MLNNLKQKYLSGYGLNLNCNKLLEINYFLFYLICFSLHQHDTPAYVGYYCGEC